MSHTLLSQPQLVLFTDPQGIEGSVDLSAK